MSLIPQRTRPTGRSSRQLVELIGESPAINRLRSLVDKISHRDCTVLIHGESGSGKELVARYAHASSPRADGPFVPVDCTTLREGLLESQLFGHTKGAFTGAERETLGFFRSADGGTLFLDEIGEMPLSVQAKLLRCIQERAVVPLGGVKAIPADVRIMAATHRDLPEMVRAGTFRQDLYYRLNVVRVEVPPLRDRRDDVAALAWHFLDWFARTYDEEVKGLSPEAMTALQDYAWPGNVRELANALEQAHVLAAGDRIELANLPEEVRFAADVGQGSPVDDEIPTLEDAEKSLIVRALAATGGNQQQAANILQIERRRMYRKVRQYKLHALTNGQGQLCCS